MMKKGVHSQTVENIPGITFSEADSESSLRARFFYRHRRSVPSLNLQFFHRQHRRHSLVLKTSFARRVHSAVAGRAFLRARATNVNSLISGRDLQIRAGI